MLSVLSASVVLTGCSCEPREQAQSSQTSRKQKQETKAHPTDPSTPIVRLEPPVMEEPKNDEPKGELLRLRLKPGYEETRTFEGKARIELDGGDPITQQINMRVTAKVQRVDGDVYEILLEPSPITVQQEGQPDQSGLLTEEPAVVDVDTRGRLLTPTNALVSTLQTIGYVPLPEKRILPGAKWSLSGERSWPLLGNVSVRETFIYRGAEKLEGRKVHHIDQLVKGSISSIKTEASYYLDADTGTLRSGEVRISGKIEIPGPDGSKSPAEVSIRLTIRKIEPPV